MVEVNKIAVEYTVGEEKKNMVQSMVIAGEWTATARKKKKTVSTNTIKWA